MRTSTVASTCTHRLHTWPLRWSLAGPLQPVRVPTGCCPAAATDRPPPAIGNRMGARAMPRPAPAYSCGTPRSRAARYSPPSSPTRPHTRSCIAARCGASCAAPRTPSPPSPARSPRLSLCGHGINTTHPANRIRYAGEDGPSQQPALHHPTQRHARVEIRATTAAPPQSLVWEGPQAVLSQRPSDPPSCESSAGVI